MDNVFQRGKMKPEHEKALLTYTDEILTIEPRDITRFLLEDNIIDKTDKLAIERKPSRKLRAEELMNVLTDRGPRAFKGFLRALQKGRYMPLASKLDAAAEPKIEVRRKLPEIPTVRKTQSLPPVINPRRNPSASLITSERAADQDGEDSGVFEDRNIRDSPAFLGLEGAVAASPIPAVRPVEDEDQAKEDDGRSEDRAVSTAIYESLSATHGAIVTQVEGCMDIISKLSEDGEGNEQLQEINDRMQKVLEDRTRLKDGPRDLEKFNRDMVLLVTHLREVLSCISNGLMEITSSLKQSQEQYKERIDHMHVEISNLKRQLDIKEQKLAEAERNQDAERSRLYMDMRSLMLENGRAQAQNQNEVLTNTQSEMKRLAADKDRLEKKLQKQIEENEKRQKEMMRNELDDVNKRIERLDREQRMEPRGWEPSEQRRGSIPTSESGYDGDSRRGSFNLFLPRTIKPSLPIKGKSVKKQPRESRK